MHDKILIDELAPAKLNNGRHRRTVRANKRDDAIRAMTPNQEKSFRMSRRANIDQAAVHAHNGLSTRPYLPRAVIKQMVSNRERQAWLNRPMRQQTDVDIRALDAADVKREQRAHKCREQFKRQVLGQSVWLTMESNRHSTLFNQK